jgi:hypothetical protein
MQQFWQTALQTATHKQAGLCNMKRPSVMNDSYLQMSLRNGAVKVAI